MAGRPAGGPGGKAGVKPGGKPAGGPPGISAGKPAGRVAGKFGSKMAGKPGAKSGGGNKSSKRPARPGQQSSKPPRPPARRARPVDPDAVTAGPIETIETIETIDAPLATQEGEDDLARLDGASPAEAAGESASPDPRTAEDVGDEDDDEADEDDEGGDELAERSDGRPDGGISGPGAGAPNRHRRTPGEQAAQLARAKIFAIEAARLLSDDRCENVVVMEVKDLSPMYDYIVVGSGTSDRQMRSVIDEVIDLAERTGHGSFRRNVDDRTTWCVVDFVDVAVHVFEPNTRAHYDIEMMWGDAPRIDWARPAGEKAPARANIRSSTIKAMNDGEEDQA